MSSRLAGAVRLLGLAAGGLALGTTFRSIDPLRAATIASSVAPLLFLVPLPCLTAATFDAVGWRLVLARLGFLVRLGPILAVRLAADAVLLPLPAGSLVADGITPQLLRARCGVPWTAGIASLAVRKWLLMTAHAVYLALIRNSGWRRSAPWPRRGLDGFTHGNHSGWAVALYPWLRSPLPFPGGPVALHDALQFWLTLVLGAAALGSWRHIAERRLLWRWRGETPRPAAAMTPGERGWATRWLAASVLAGVGVGMAKAAWLVSSRALPLAAFGGITFLLAGALVAAAVDRLRRPLAGTTEG